MSEGLGLDEIGVHMASGESSTPRGSGERATAQRAVRERSRERKPRGRSPAAANGRRKARASMLAVRVASGSRSRSKGRTPRTNGRKHPTSAPGPGARKKSLRFEDDGGARTPRGDSSRSPSGGSPGRRRRKVVGRAASVMALTSSGKRHAASRERSRLRNEVAVGGEDDGEEKRGTPKNALRTRSSRGIGSGKGSATSRVAELREAGSEDGDVGSLRSTDSSDLGLPQPEAGSVALAALMREPTPAKKRHRPKVVKIVMDGPSKVKQKEQQRKKGKEIDRRHALYHLSYGMMFGISNAVRKYQNRADLVMSDFMHIHKYVFPAKKGHILNHTFKFKDYCPKVFRHLRERFGINDKQYLVSFSGKFNFIEFISNSKSGQFFFYSHNGRFMIKTQSYIESKFLRRIMPHYYQYVMKNPHTYITRFYGMHRLKMNHLGKKMHFVVMQSVFEGDQEIHETYDLKGSTHGRAATEEELARGPAKCVMKDLDMLRRLEEKGKLKFGRSRKDFLHQIQKDVAFLERMKIMDYSLLLGIHYPKKKNTPGLRRRSVQLSPDSGLAAVDVLRKLRKRQEARGLGKVEEGKPADDDDDVPPRAQTLSSRGRRGLRSVSSEPVIKKRSDRRRFGDIMTRDDDLRIDGENKDGTACDEIYHMGIIDILQQYDSKKTIETFFKSFTTKKSTISSVNPQQYGERFVSFMTQISE